MWLVCTVGLVGPGRGRLPRRGLSSGWRAASAAVGRPPARRRGRDAGKARRHRGARQAATSTAASAFGLTVPLISVTAVGEYPVLRVRGDVHLCRVPAGRPHPLDLSLSAASLVFLLWIMGVTGPARRPDRRALRLAAARRGAVRRCRTVGVLLTLPSSLLPADRPSGSGVSRPQPSPATPLRSSASVTSRAPIAGRRAPCTSASYYGFGALGAYLPGLAWEFGQAGAASRRAALARSRSLRLGSSRSGAASLDSGRLRLRRSSP